MRRGYSYKRFSSQKQSRGDSIRRQTEFEAEIVKEMDLHLDDSLDLTDRAKSAFRGDNARFGALAEFLRLVESGRIPHGSVLIVENIDRLSRENVLDAFNLFSRIICAGITIATATPRDVYDGESVASDLSQLMVPLVYMIRAHDESATKSKRLHAAWSRRRERALAEGVPLTGRCPAWLRVTPAGYEVIPDRVKTLRRLFAMVADGLGLRRATQAIIAEGHKPFGRSGAWNESYVRKLLTWPAVCGEMQPHVYVNGVKTPHGDPVQGYFPAVIDRDTFRLVQATMAGRKGREGRPARGEGNLFTGIVYHAVDRVRMVRVTSGAGKTRRYTYLQSYDVQRGEKVGKGGRSLPYDPFEEAVLNAVDELKQADLIDRAADGAAGLDARIQKLTGHLMVLDHRYREADAKLLDPTNTTPAEELHGRLDRLSDKRRQVADELARLQADALNCRAESLGEVQSVIRLMAKAKGKERLTLRRKAKARLRWLLSEVWVYVEPVNKYTRVVHVQLFLRNGTRRPLWFVARHPATAAGREMVRPRRTFEDVDFRTTDPSGLAPERTNSGQQPKPVKARTRSQTSKQRP
jgi:DNA invertase Pin-like site-specific DNA recombinase